MPQDHHYRAQISWSGASRGSTTDYKSYSREYLVEVAGKPPHKGSADPAFLGDPALPNPEDQLLASLSACHMLSYLALCANSKIVVTAYSDDATGTMAQVDGQYKFTEVVLHPRVTLAAGSNLEKAKALHERAHSICFIARSVNFPVKHEAAIVTA